MSDSHTAPKYNIPRSRWECWLFLAYLPFMTAAAFLVGYWKAQR